MDKCSAGSIRATLSFALKLILAGFVLAQPYPRIDACNSPALNSTFPLKYTVGGELRHCVCVWRDWRLLFIVQYLRILALSLFLKCFSIGWGEGSSPQAKRSEPTHGRNYSVSNAIVRPTYTSMSRLYTSLSTSVAILYLFTSHLRSSVYWRSLVVSVSASFSSSVLSSVCLLFRLVDKRIAFLSRWLLTFRAIRVCMESNRLSKLWLRAGSLSGQ